jgi:manganese efflux pump family protein
MSLIYIIGISLSLAMDAFSVAVVTGITLTKINWRHIFRLSWHFGLFQALMPALGWLLGLSFKAYIESYDHWIAFILLCTVGLKMIIESFKKSENKKITDPTRGKTLVMLSVATSIDAFAVGLSFSLLNIPIILPCLMIGLITLMLTALGIYIGKSLRNIHIISRLAELTGGIILILIGLKILMDHGVFS